MNLDKLRNVCNSLGGSFSKRKNRAVCTFGKSVKKKRKLTAYNMHMSREMKSGKSFTEARKSWKR